MRDSCISPCHISCLLRIPWAHITKDICPDLCTYPFPIWILPPATFRGRHQIANISIRYSFSSRNMTHCKTCKPHPCNLITRKIFSINFKSFQAYDCIICIIILWHIYNVINPVSDSITKCIFSIITYIIFMNYFF